MSTKTLDQPVQKNDLILVHGPKDTCMVVVTLSPINQDTNPPTSSIFVQRVNWHIPDAECYWTLDGPSVYYVDSGSCPEANYRSYMSKDHSISSGAFELSYVLEKLGLQNETPRTRSNKGFTVTVKPHGRDVLKHYFNGWCPNCGIKGWFTTASHPFSGQFPAVPGSFTTDQACPVCMGYKFALDDKARIARIDRFLDQYCVRERSQETHADPELKKIRSQVLQLITERYQAISARRQEMGMALKDFEKSLEDYRCSFGC